MSSVIWLTIDPTNEQGFPQRESVGSELLPGDAWLNRALLSVTVKIVAEPLACNMQSSAVQSGPAYMPWLDTYREAYCVRSPFAGVGRSKQIMSVMVLVFSSVDYYFEVEK
jgi:hypothetical protein